METAILTAHNQKYSLDSEGKISRGTLYDLCVTESKLQIGISKSREVWPLIFHLLSQDTVSVAFCPDAPGGYHGILLLKKTPYLGAGPGVIKLRLMAEELGASERASKKIRTRFTEADFLSYVGSEF